MGVRERDSLAFTGVCRDTVCEKVRKSKGKGNLINTKYFNFWKVHQDLSSLN